MSPGWCLDDGSRVRDVRTSQLRNVIKCIRKGDPVSGPFRGRVTEKGHPAHWLLVRTAALQPRPRSGSTHRIPAS